MAAPHVAGACALVWAEHPEWFFYNPDGTIRYAENPPKKYQDVCPLNFEPKGRQIMWEEIKKIYENKGRDVTFVESMRQLADEKKNFEERLNDATASDRPCRQTPITPPIAT